MGKQLPSYEQIIAELPETTSLYYVDYRDNFDENLEKIQESVHDNLFEAIECNMYEWFDDYESVKEVIKELISDVAIKYDIKEKKIKKLINSDEYYDGIRDAIYERDTSDPFKDMCRNTSKIIFYYDTGYQVASESWNWDDKEIAKERQRIKRILKIRGNNEYDAVIELMIREASYGGQLVIYFQENFEDLITNTETDYKSIEFTNMNIAIINTVNGSGDNCYIPRHTAKMQFVRSNLFICKLDTYSYTYEVCGMVRDWCDKTSVKLNHKPIRGKSDIEESASTKHRETEAKYNATFKAGGCTFGDINITRHRNTPYRNDYPCGNTCTSCGQFWID